MIFTAAFAMTAVSATTVSANSSLHLSTNKISTSSKYISGKATPHSKVSMTRYGKIYAKGISTKHGTFKIHLRHTLSSGLKYRMTACKKGCSVKKTYVFVPKKTAPSGVKATPYAPENNPNTDGNFSTSQNTTPQINPSANSDAQITQNINASPDFAAYMNYCLFTDSPATYNDWLKEHDPSRANWDTSTNNDDQNDNDSNPSNNITPSDQLTSEQIAAYNQQLSTLQAQSKDAWNKYNNAAAQIPITNNTIKTDQQYIDTLTKMERITFTRMAAVQKRIAQETDPSKLAIERDNLQNYQADIHSYNWQYGNGETIEWWQAKLSDDQSKLTTQTNALNEYKSDATSIDNQIQNIDALLARSNN